MNFGEIWVYENVVKIFLLYIWYSIFRTLFNINKQRYRFAKAIQLIIDDIINYYLYY